MVLFDGVGGLVLVGLWIFCFIDVIFTPESECRNLPKLVWLFLVLILPDIGSIAWLIAGRPWNRTATQAPRTRATGAPARARNVATNPDDDEAFLAGLQARADEQRRRAREQSRGKQDGTHLEGDAP